MSDIGGGANLGVATFRIDGDASGAVNASQKANAALSQLEVAVAGNWWGIKNLGLAFAALPAAIAAGTSKAIIAAKDWETAMAGVERTTFDATKSVQENETALHSLEGQLKDIGRSKPIATVEIAGIAEAAGSLGIAQKDIASFTSVVADLAATTDLTADSAATNLARIAGLTGVPAAGYKNLASSILETGRATAATEPDIVGLATKLAGLAAQYGLTSSEVIGLAAAVRSAGIPVEAGGTAIQKTFSDIGFAVSANGKDLETYAQIAGMSASQFKKAWASDAAGAFTSVIEGLGNLNAKGVSTDQVLAGLGITESRQVRALNLLAAAQHQNVNENLKLSNILGISNKAYADGTAITEIARKRYETLASQLQILRNQIFEVAVSFGNLFLPVLKLTAGVIGDFVEGFRQIPGPIKAVFGVLVAFVGVVTGLAAIFILLGARVVLAYSALRQLEVSWRAGQKAALDQQRAVQAYEASLLELDNAIRGSYEAELVRNAAQLRSIAAAEAAMLADTERRVSINALVAAQAKQGEMELAFTLAELRLAKARMEMARVEQEARIAGSMSLIRGFGALEAAEAELLAAQELLAKSGRDLTTANQGVILSTVEMGAAQRRSAGAAAEAAIAGKAATIATNNASGAASLAGKATEDAAGKAAKAGANAGGEVSRLSGVVGKFGKVLGYVGTALAVFSILTAVFGHNAKSTADSLDGQAKSQKRLEDAMVKGGKAGLAQANAFIKQRIESAEAKDGVDRLGYSYEQLQKFVRGTASAKEWQQFIDTTTKASKKGVAGADELVDTIRKLNQQYRASQDAAIALGASTDQVGFASESAAAKQQKEAVASQEQADRAKDVVDAYNSFVDALFAAREAAFSVEDAQKSLSEAEYKAANATHFIAEAELELAKARLDQKKAALDVKDAEFDLSTARERQAENVRSALLSLESAQSTYEDSVQATADAAKALQDFQDPKNTDDLTKAVLKLADARIKLRDASEAVSDAEFNLRHLQEIGAGKKDIQDAQNAISDARLDAAHATQDQTDAEKELAKLNDPLERAKKLAELEGNLSDARRQEAQNAIAVEDAERSLTKARLDAANDRLYIEAQSQLADANAAVLASADKVHDSETALAELRGGSLQKDAQRAALEYEQTLYRQAQALSTIKDTLAEIQGKELTASEKTKNLVDSLKEIAKSLPDGPAKKNLEDIIRILNSAPKVPKSTTLDGGDDGFTTPILTGGSPLDNEPIGKEKGENTVSFWEGIKEQLGPIFTFIGGLIGPSIAGAIAGGEAGSFAGPIGTVVGAIAGLLFAELLKRIYIPLFQWFSDTAADVREKGSEKLRDAFFAALDFLKELPGKISEGLTALPGIVSEFFSELPRRAGRALGLFVGTVGRTLTQVGPTAAKAMFAVPALIVGALVAAIPVVYQFFAELPGKISDFLIENGPVILKFFQDLPINMLNAILGAIEFVYQFFRDLPTNFYNLLIEEGPKLLKWFEDLPGNILKALGDLAQLLFQKGLDVVGGFYDGFTEAWPEAGEWLSGMAVRILNAMGAAADFLTTLVEHGKNIIQGLWDGMISVWNKVKEWVKGIIKWIIDHKGPVEEDRKALNPAGEAIMHGLWDGMKKIWPKFKEWIAGMIGGVLDSAGNVVNKAGDIIGGTISGVGDVINSIFSRKKEIEDAGSFVGNTMADALGKALSGGIDKQKKDMLKDFSAGLFPGVSAFDVNAAINPVRIGGTIDGLASLMPKGHAPTTIIHDSHDTVDFTGQVVGDPKALVSEYLWQRKPTIRGRVKVGSV